MKTPFSPFFSYAKILHDEDINISVPLHLSVTEIFQVYRLAAG